HPADSAKGDAGRGRLSAELRGVGLGPRVTDHFACNSNIHSRAINCARVRNLVATMGPIGSGQPALLLVCHYDSTFAGPGAADDGIGVASLLEIAALLRGARLERPVIFLFAAGGELG